MQAAYINYHNVGIFYYSACPVNCASCTDDGAATRCRHDSCNALSTWRSTDGTCSGNHKIPVKAFVLKRPVEVGDEGMMTGVIA